MATLTELHRETKKVVRQAMIEGSVSITEHGSVVARIEAERPLRKRTREEVLAAFEQCTLTDTPNA